MQCVHTVFVYFVYDLGLLISASSNSKAYLYVSSISGSLFANGIYIHILLIVSLTHCTLVWICVMDYPSQADIGCLCFVGIN